MIDLRLNQVSSSPDNTQNKRSTSEKIIHLLNSYERIPKNKKNVNNFLEALITNGELIRFIERKNWRNGFCATISIKDFLSFTESGITKNCAKENTEKQFFNYIKLLQKLIDDFETSKLYNDLNYFIIKKYLDYLKLENQQLIRKLATTNSEILKIHEFSTVLTVEIDKLISFTSKTECIKKDNLKTDAYLKTINFLLKISKTVYKNNDNLTFTKTNIFNNSSSNNFIKLNSTTSLLEKLVDFVQKG